MNKRTGRITQTPKQKVLFSKTGRSNYCTPTPGPIGPSVLTCAGESRGDTGTSCGAGNNVVRCLSRLRNIRRGFNNRVIRLSDCRLIFRANHNLACVCWAKVAPVAAKE